MLLFTLVFCSLNVKVVSECYQRYQIDHHESRVESGKPTIFVVFPEDDLVIFKTSVKHLFQFIFVISFQFLMIRKNFCLEVLLFHVSGFSLVLIAFIKDHFLWRIWHCKYKAKPYPYFVYLSFRLSVSVQPASQPASGPFNR